MLDRFFKISERGAHVGGVFSAIVLFSGKYTKKDIMATIIAVIFLAKFAFVTM